MLEDQNKVNRPILTDDTKERIQRSLQQSLEYNEEVFLLLQKGIFTSPIHNSDFYRSRKQIDSLS